MNAVKRGFQAMMTRKYELWGQDVTFNHPCSGDEVTLRMIDATRGVDIGDNMITMSTVEPAAMVRKSELTAADLRASDLIGMPFTLNGSSWRVQSTQPRPTVHGAEYGEIVLLLARTCD